VANQQPHRLGAAQTRRHKKRRRPVDGPRVRCGAAVEQQLCLCRVASGPHQRGRAVGVRGIHPGAGVNQQSHISHRRVCGGIHQRRGAGLVCRIGIDARVERPLQCIGVAAPDDVEYARLGEQQERQGDCNDQQAEQAFHDYSIPLNRDRSVKADRSAAVLFANERP
jgi:hypothetical protein